MNTSLKKCVAGLSLLGVMAAAPISSSSVFAAEAATQNVDGVSVEKANLGQGKLTKKQKEAYYKQYVEIIKEVVAGHPGVEMEVVPFDQYAETDWITPEEFRKLAIDRANLKFGDFRASSSSGPVTLATISKTKSVDFDAKGVAVSLSITGSFETGYNSSLRRQVFTGINSVTSRASSGSWTQTGYTPSRIDGGRTYAIYVGGKYVLNSISSTHNLYVEFYCDEKGGIS